MKADIEVGSAVRIELLAMAGEAVSGITVIDGHEFMVANDRLPVRDLIRYVTHVYGDDAGLVLHLPRPRSGAPVD